MGGELRKIDIAFTTRSTDNLPDGMYADDVAAEISSVVSSILQSWYETRGKLYLSCEPDVIGEGNGRRCDYVDGRAVPCLLHRGHIRSHWPAELPSFPEIGLPDSVLVVSDRSWTDPISGDRIHQVLFEE